MRRSFDLEPNLDILPIEQIKLPVESRDELPPILAGLQWIWTHPTLKADIFRRLEKVILADRRRTGRQGMDLWQILVLGTVRLGLDADWDRMEHIANYDLLLRQMLGVNLGGGLFPKKCFNRRTLRDNVALLDESLLEQINGLIAQAGREPFQPKKGPQPMVLRVDSYVLETDVHFPTDLNLLWDSGRKCLEAISGFVERGVKLEGWRKLAFWRKQLKSEERTASKASSGGGKNKEQRVKDQVREYLNTAREISVKVKASRRALASQCSEMSDIIGLTSLDYYERMLDKHIDLVDRRVLRGEDIPVAEKLYSIFEPHTEWINKGKSHPNVELGHRVLVATDENQLIHHYQGPSGVDVNESIPVVDSLLGRYGEGSIASVSFDKGFSRAEDKELLELYIPVVVMPKRGKRTQEQTQEERSKKFSSLRRAHSAVESAINALEHHGLDSCLDVGLEGFKRYVGFGVMAYNLHLIGRRLLDQQRERQHRRAA